MSLEHMSVYISYNSLWRNRSLGNVGKGVIPLETMPTPYLFLNRKHSDIIQTTDMESTPAQYNVKGKGLPQQVEMAQGAPRRLRSRVFLTFGTTRVVGRQPHAPAAFIPMRNPWY